MSIYTPHEAFQIGYAYFEAGLNIIPLRADGSRKPWRKWRKYMLTRCPWETSRQWLHDGSSGIAIICGTTSGNLEVLDFDSPEAFPRWQAGLAPGLLDGLPIVETPKGGRHVYYRCEIIEGSQVLAKKPDGKPLIETRGQGGFAVAPGSPLTTHPLGRPYRLLAGKLTAVPLIEPERRAALFAAARPLTQYTPPPKPVAKPAEPKPDRSLLAELYGLDEGDTNQRPGDLFNAQASWDSILEPHEWTIEAVRGGTTYWRKPGSRGNEHHATTNHGGSDRLFVFSTAAPPFEAGRSYSKFAAFALLNHQGDFSQAAKALIPILHAEYLC
jgi:putative DNA primase/helicase